MSEYYVVFVTINDAEKAAVIGKTIVEEGLAACANIIPGLRSIYKWQGKICDDSEILLIIKTVKAKYKALEKRIKTMHPYEVPEIIALSIDQGLPDYLKWIDRLLQNENFFKFKAKN
jgi:periplasmic divalent cation tolerance protein